MSIHQIEVEIFQFGAKWWTNPPTGQRLRPQSHASSMSKSKNKNEKSTYFESDVFSLIINCFQHVSYM